MRKGGRNKTAAQSFFNGILLVDKPSGFTSHDVVNKVRRIMGTRTVGHCGTLDPLASGLLIVLVGQATKLSDYLLQGDKGYDVTVQLGIKTDTFDAEGNIIAESAVNCREEDIDAAVAELTGDIELPVPIHSAVKKDGKKLYEYARSGKEVEVPLRVTRFFDIHWQTLNHDQGTSPSLLNVSLRCTKGGFIRSWVNALGEKLGCGAMVKELRRSFSHPYSVQRSLTLPFLEEMCQKFMEQQEEQGLLCRGEKGHLLNSMELERPFLYFLEDFSGDASDDTLEGIIPISSVLPDWGRVIVDSRDERLLGNGQISRDLKSKLLQNLDAFQVSPGVKVLSRQSGRLVALVGNERGKGFFIRRVFPTAAPLQ